MRMMLLAHSAALCTAVAAHAASAGLVAGGLTTTVGQCRLCTSVSLTLPRPTADSTPLHKRTGRVNLLVAKDVKMRGASSPFEGSEAARADDGDVAVV
jgi:hypothetical protein